MLSDIWDGLMQWLDGCANIALILILLAAAVAAVVVVIRSMP